MATQMLNFGGTVSANAIGQNNGSRVIAQQGAPDSQFQLQTTRAQGSTIIVFSIVLNNTGTANATVDLSIVDSGRIIPSEIVSIGKGITVVPGRAVSLDYKINLLPTNALYITSSLPGSVDVVISTVQM